MKMSLPVAVVASVVGFSASAAEYVPVDPPDPTTLEVVHTNLVVTDDNPTHDAKNHIKAIRVIIPDGVYLIFDSLDNQTSEYEPGKKWDTRLVVSGTKGRTLFSFATVNLPSQLGNLELLSSCWLLDRPFARSVFSYGSDVWVRENITLSADAYFRCGSAGQQVRVDEGVTFTCKFRFYGNQITKTGGGTVYNIGSIAGNDTSWGDKQNLSGYLTVKEGVWDMSGKTSNNYFYFFPSTNFNTTVKVREDGLLRLHPTLMADLRNLVLDGGTVEGGPAFLNNSITVLPNAKPSTITLSLLRMSHCGDTNSIDVAEGATLKINAPIDPGRGPDGTTSVDTRIVRTGAGRLEINGALRATGVASFDVAGETEVTLDPGETVPAALELEVAAPSVLNEAAIWLDADDLTGYADGQFVNEWKSKGTFDKAFVNPKKGVITTDKRFTCAIREVPGPEYWSGALNGRAALKFCYTNCLYTTEYRNYGKEFTLFYVGSQYSLAESRQRFNPNIGEEYSLIDFTYSGSPYQNYDTAVSRLWFSKGGESAYFAGVSKVTANRISLTPPSGFARGQPNVYMATRREAVGTYAIWSTDANGTASTTQNLLSTNVSNIFDRVCLGGVWCSTFGPYLRVYNADVLDEDGNVIHKAGEDDWGSRMASGYLGEFIAFERVLTDEEQALVSGYLRRKWMGSAVTIATSVKPSKLTLSSATGSATVASDVAVKDDALAMVGISNRTMLAKGGAGEIDLTGDLTSVKTLEVTAGTLGFGADVTVPEDLALVVSNGATVASAVTGPITLGSLAAGENVGFVRRAADGAAASDFKMFAVTGLFALGASPSFLTATLPEGRRADVISYGEGDFADPLSWTTAKPGRQRINHDAANRKFVFDAVNGLILLFR